MMLATNNFTMRISPQEKAMLVDIAKFFKRSQSDTLKILIHELWRMMKDEENTRVLENKKPDVMRPAEDPK